MPGTAQPPLSLPLEIITTIAGFVAGNNDFGTLASLCVTSRLLKAECERIWIETVVWSHKGPLDENMKKGQDTQVFPESWRHIRYAFPSLWLTRFDCC